MRLLCIAACIHLLVHSASAASIYTETFTTGSNGWQGAAGSWTFTGGAARVFFSNIAFPLPQTATLQSTPIASSGAFTGNYEEAGIEMVGFTFIATSVFSSIVFRWTGEWDGNTSVYQRLISGVQSGGTYRFATQLVNSDGWAFMSGNTDDFETARSSVRYVSVVITRAGVTNRTYYVDDIFLAGLPVATAIGRTETNALITWSPVRSNYTYVAEMADSPMSTSWTAFASFTATDTVAVVVDTNTPFPDQRTYRLVIP